MDTDRSHPDLSANWIRANFDAALVALVLGLIGFGLRQAFGLTEPGAALMTKGALIAIEVILAAAAFFVFAVRTGVVLVQRFSAFPLLTWNAMHVLIGAGMGVVVALSEMGTEPVPYETPAASYVAGVAFGGVVAGTLLSAAYGWLQSLVLRKVARNVGVWINWSALSGVAFGAYGLALYVSTEPTLTNEFLTQTISFAITMVGAFVMLPALHALEPH